MRDCHEIEKRRLPTFRHDNAMDVSTTMRVGTAHFCVCSLLHWFQKNANLHFWWHNSDRSTRPPNTHFSNLFHDFGHCIAAEKTHCMQTHHVENPCIFSLACEDCICQAQMSWCQWWTRNKQPNTAICAIFVFATKSEIVFREQISSRFRPARNGRNGRWNHLHCDETSARFRLSRRQLSWRMNRAITVDETVAHLHDKFDSHMKRRFKVFTEPRWRSRSPHHGPCCRRNQLVNLRRCWVKALS